VTIRYPVGVYSGEVEWDFINLAGSPMSVTDSTGLKLFDTGPRHSPATFHYIFKWAGNYPYHSTSDGTRGLVRVTMTRHPGKGALGTGFTLTWASAGRKNCVFDVEVHRPGATRWGFAKFATTNPHRHLHAQGRGLVRDPKPDPKHGHEDVLEVLAVRADPRDLRPG
jgi:hypothetical protein